MPESRPLGPWMKLYADVVERKAHYSDAQFRGLIRVFAIAIRARGVLPRRPAIAALIGKKVADFLFEEGDLEEDAAGAVVVHRWTVYQSRDETAAERQRRHRQTAVMEEDVTAVSRPVTRDNEDVTPRHVVTPTSTSTSHTLRSEDDSEPRRRNGKRAAPSADLWNDPEREPVERPLSIWLSRHGAHLDEGAHPKMANDLSRLAEHPGVEIVLAEFERLAKNPANRTTAQFIYGADRALHKIETPVAGFRPVSDGRTGDVATLRAKIKRDSTLEEDR